MDLSKIQQLISDSGFPSILTVKMQEILDKTKETGTMSDEDKKRLVEMVKLGIDVLQLEAETEEEMAEAEVNYLDEMTRALQLGEKVEDQIVQMADDTATQLNTELDELEKPAAPTT